MRLVLAAAAAVALLAVQPAGPATRPAPAALIQKGLAEAVAAGRLMPDEVDGYRADLARARAEVTRLPPLRATLLETVIGDVAAQWRCTRTRAR